MAAHLTASVWQEGDWYVAQCREVVVASQGRTSGGTATTFRSPAAKLGRTCKQESPAAEGKGGGMMATYASKLSPRPDRIRTMYGAAEWKGPTKWDGFHPARCARPRPGLRRAAGGTPTGPSETIPRAGTPAPGLAVVQEADDSDDTTAQFTHDEGVTIMPGVGTILSVREDSASHFLHTDAQGTTREATDSSQAIDATYDLDAFGVLRGLSGAFTTPYLFTGKERDPGPGLDYFIARQYAPTLGVFLSKDPIPTPTWMYSYAHQGPLSGWDPDGAQAAGQWIADRCINELRDLMRTEAYRKMKTRQECVTGPPCREAWHVDWAAAFECRWFRVFTIFIPVPTRVKTWCWECVPNCGWKTPSKITTRGVPKGGRCRVLSSGTSYNHAQSMHDNCRHVSTVSTDILSHCVEALDPVNASGLNYYTLVAVVDSLNDVFRNCIVKGCLYGFTTPRMPTDPLCAGP